MEHLSNTEAKMKKIIAYKKNRPNLKSGPCLFQK